MKIIKYYLFLQIVITLFVSSCKTNKQSIDLSFFETEKPVILRYNTQYNKIVRIQIPLGLKITNKSLKKRTINSIEYRYSDYRKGIGSLLYKFEGFERHGRKRIALNAKSERMFVMYSAHRVDTIDTIQKHLNGYLDLLSQKQKDKITIEGLKEFKHKNEDFFNLLTKGDSILVKILKGYGKTETINVIDYAGGDVYEKEVQNIYNDIAIFPIDW